MLQCSVGPGGQNSPVEVKIVQHLLNDWLSRNAVPMLKVDGRVGPKTIGAISEFQKRNRLAIVDGRVNPNGPTIKKLVEMQFSGVYKDISSSPLAVDLLRFVRSDPSTTFDSKDMGIDGASAEPVDIKAAFVATLRQLISAG